MIEEELFHRALEKPTLAEQLAFLDQVCAEQPEVRQRVERLLRSHRHDDSFLHPPVTTDESRAEQTGMTIGPYKLIEQIGEGGMGTVWMAQQTEPVKRLLALKLIKAGMDSKQVIARFEAERQALALMDHPNIARVLDGGTTDAGRPYFVMDLVKGVPITKYCDEHHFTPRQRLELFIPVCQAVQHAHQKGIIHRDLKPSNVLVALYDGKPVPKVIDFGVAKAAGQSLTDKTLVTGFGNIVGTLEYMSPEQAEINQLDIDTRSDIYSLGVLLYELLTGSPPFSRKELEKAGMLEMLRVIREQEPSKPSTKLSTAEGLPTLAANRGTEPAKLTKLVRGELDWIVMKALEKDRGRRYETANGFAMDVQRYLADERVLACPPSAGYRFRKFARRNNAALVTAAVVSTALILGILVSTWQAIRATSAERLADHRLKEETAARQAEEKQRQAAEAQRLAAEQARKRATDNLRLARNAVDQMLTQVGNKDLVYVPQMEPLRRALLEKALQFYRTFLEGNPDDPGIRLETANAYQRIGELYDRLGQYPDAERNHRESIRILESLEAEFPREPEYELQLAVTYRALTNTLGHLRQWPKAEQAARQSLVRARKLTAELRGKADYRHSLASSLCHLGVVLQQLGRYPESGEALREALSLYETLAAEDPLNPDHRWNLAIYSSSLAGVLAQTGQPQEAEEAQRRAIQFNGKLVAEFPDNPEYLHGLAHNRLKLGLALRDKKHLQDAEKEIQAAIELDAKAVTDYPKTTQFRASLAESQYHLARLCRATGRLREAESLYRQAVENLKILVAEAPSRPQYSVHLIERLVGLARVMSQSGQTQQAVEVIDQAVAIRDRLEKEFGEKAEIQRDLATSDLAMGVALKEAGQRDEAIRAFRKALSQWEKLAAEFRDTKYRFGLAQAHDQLGYLLPRQQAEQEFRTAVGIYEKLVAETRGEQAVYSANLGHSRRNLAYKVWAAGNTKEAEELFGEALSDFEKLTAAHPDNSSYWQFQADSQRLVGTLLALRKQFPEAEKAYRRAIELHEQRMARFPHQPITEADEEPLRLHEVAASCSGLAGLLAANGRAQEAQTFHKKAIAIYGKVIELQPNSPNAHNEIAWILATHPEASLRDPKRAVELAKKAVELMPGEGNFWNTLGAAQYRAGDWNAVIAALDKSMALRKGGDGNDWFFLAMAHWRLGKKDKARQWYDRAVEWMDMNQPNNGELRRFRTEAAELLQLSEKK